MEKMSWKQNILMVKSVTVPLYASVVIWACVQSVNDTDLRRGSGEGWSC